MLHSCRRAGFKMDPSCQLRVGILPSQETDSQPAILCCHSESLVAAMTTVAMPMKHECVGGLKFRQISSAKILSISKAKNHPRALRHRKTTWRLLYISRLVHIARLIKFKERRQNVVQRPPHYNIVCTVHPICRAGSSLAPMLPEKKPHTHTAVVQKCTMNGPRDHHVCLLAGSPRNLETILGRKFWP